MDALNTRRVGTYKKLITSKKLGFWGAVSLLFNSASGPGIPFTPGNFQSPGEAMQAIPGNKHFQGDVEYGTLINFYFEPWKHLLGQGLLFGALQSNAIQGIVLSAQAIDHLFVTIFGKSCGLSFTQGWVCTATHTDISGNYLPSPFGNEFVLFTLGFVVVFFLTVPLGLVNLDDNIWVQYGSFIFSVFMILQWNSAGLIEGLHMKYIMPPISSTSVASYGNVLGTAMLNLATTTIIPSWINIKQKEVNVQHCVWTSMSIITAVYVVTGVILAASFPDLGNDSILIHLLSAGKPVVLTAITVYAFGFVMLIPSIPVSLIISRENLVQNKVVSEKIASIASFLTPWIVSIPFLTGDNLQLFQVITSALFVATSNFILPMLIYFKCVDFRKTYNAERTLTDHQKELLRAIHRASSKVSRYLDNLGKQAPTLKVTEAATVQGIPDEGLRPPQSSGMYKTGNNHSNTSVYSLELLPSQQREIISEASKQHLLPEESSKTLDSTEIWGNEDVPDPDMEDIIARKQTENMGTMGTKSRMGNMSGLFTFGRKRSEAPAEATETSSRAHLSPNDILEIPDTTVRIPLNDLDDHRHSKNEVYLATLQRNIPKDLTRIGTLPMHPKFRTPAFRTVPSWLPFKGDNVARIVLVITFVITVMTIGVNIYQLANPSSN
ncbi:hypothetical protein HDV01_000597 [Terramyces sp. JEL0728]|nr:hypothetical protein HDV01_000597 [Terramyces sp. JEL0728]